MRRIVCHWTAGSHKASALDRTHYHILIEDDGNLVRGTHPISDNVSTADGNYAAHTRRLNTGSIGVSVCCMARPDLTYQDPSLAARILVQGVRDGTFRPGHKLVRYINDEGTDFYNARAIVNADKARLDPGHTEERGPGVSLGKGEHAEPSGTHDARNGRG